MRPARAGIELRRGEHRGRLVIPCDHIEAETRRYYSHVINSDDQGATWDRRHHPERSGQRVRGRRAPRRPAAAQHAQLRPRAANPAAGLERRRRRHLARPALRARADRADLPSEHPPLLGPSADVQQPSEPVRARTHDAADVVRRGPNVALGGADFNGPSAYSCRGKCCPTACSACLSRRLPRDPRAPRRP